MAPIFPPTINEFPEYDPLETKYVEGLEAITPSGLVPIGSVIDQRAQEYNISALVLAGLLEQESGFQTHDQVTGEILGSPMGARGIAQVMPGTEVMIEGRLGKDLDMGNALDGIEAAANELAYLRNSINEYSGGYASRSNVLAGYNAGLGNVQQSIDWGNWYNQDKSDSDYGVPNIDETHRYVSVIPTHMKNMQSNYDWPEAGTAPVGQGKMQEGEYQFEPGEDIDEYASRRETSSSPPDYKKMFTGDQEKPDIYLPPSVDPRREQYQKDVSSGLLPPGKIKATGKWAI